MKPVSSLLVAILFIWFSAPVHCQAIQQPLTDTTSLNNAPKPVQQQDIADLVKRLYPQLHIRTHDSATLEEGKRFVLVIPQVGYTLQTRALAAVLINTPFRMANANMSSITGPETRNRG